MTEIKSIDPQKFNVSLAEALKKVPEFKQPEWSLLVKSSSHNERPIVDDDFWFKRAASILRQIYLKKVVGVQRLRTRYGGRKNRGVRPDMFVKSGGKIIRTILQQSEAAGLTEKVKGRHSGRKLTDKGKALLEGVK